MQVTFFVLASMAAKEEKAYEINNSSTLPETIIPHENDILLGRGGKNNQHIGNERLRELARKECEHYQRLSKKGKSDLSRSLVMKVRKMIPPGRFLKRDLATNLWEDVGDDIAREKVSQVLRDAVCLASQTMVTPAVSEDKDLRHSDSYVDVLTFNFSCDQTNNETAMSNHRYQQDGFESSFPGAGVSPIQAGEFYPDNNNEFSIERSFTPTTHTNLKKKDPVLPPITPISSSTRKRSRHSVDQGQQSGSGPRKRQSYPYNQYQQSPSFERYTSTSVETPYGHPRPVNYRNPYAYPIQNQYPIIPGFREYGDSATAPPHQHYGAGHHIYPVASYQHPELRSPSDASATTPRQPRHPGANTYTDYSLARHRDFQPPLPTHQGGTNDDARHRDFQPPLPAQQGGAIDAAPSYPVYDGDYHGNTSGGPPDIPSLSRIGRDRGYEDDYSRRHRDFNIPPVQHRGGSDAPATSRQHYTRDNSGYASQNDRVFQSPSAQQSGDDRNWYYGNPGDYSPRRPHH